MLGCPNGHLATVLYFSSCYLLSILRNEAIGGRNSIHRCLLAFYGGGA